MVTENGILKIILRRKQRMGWLQRIKMKEEKKNLTFEELENGDDEKSKSR